MADLSPFRTVVDLKAPPRTIVLTTRVLDVSPDFYDADESGWWESCDEHNWDGSDYINSSIKSAQVFWEGTSLWSSGGSGDAAHPDPGGPLTWGAGEYSYRYTYAGGLTTGYAFGGRWVPMESAPVEGHEDFFSGNTISLRFWGYHCGGPRMCRAGRTWPLVTDAGRVNLSPPPEERDDLTIFPGAVTLTFTDQVVDGVTYEPIGIQPLYTDFVSEGHYWIAREQPFLKVLYRVKS